MDEEESKEAPTYLISWRLQRVTTEYGFVSVPVTSEILAEQGDGTARIDPDKMMQMVLEMGKSPDVQWNPESAHIHPHPVQQAPQEWERGPQAWDKKKLP